MNRCFFCINILFPQNRVELPAEGRCLRKEQVCGSPVSPFHMHDVAMAPGDPVGEWPSLASSHWHLAREVCLCITEDLSGLVWRKHEAVERS